MARRTESAKDVSEKNPRAVSADKAPNPHRRTRRDHATETAEDYVEAIAEIIERQGSCRGVDLSRRFAVSHVTVNRIVARLQNEGLLNTEPYRPIELTPRGRKLATSSKRRHDIVEQFLLAIGVDANVGGVGIAMLLLIVISGRLQAMGLMAKPTPTTAAMPSPTITAGARATPGPRGAPAGCGRRVRQDPDAAAGVRS